MVSDVGDPLASDRLCIGISSSQFMYEVRDKIDPGERASEYDEPEPGVRMNDDDMVDDDDVRDGAYSRTEAVSCLFFKEYLLELRLSPRIRLHFFLIMLPSDSIAEVDLFFLEKLLSIFPDEIIPDETGTVGNEYAISSNTS